MKRQNPWDIVVIGGGATGVGVAVDAASRGYDVLLVEQYDFGKGTSSRSTKLVHGGVRYRYLPVAWAGPRAGQVLFHALLPFAARRIPHELWIESFTPPFSASDALNRDGAAVQDPAIVPLERPPSR